MECAQCKAPLREGDDYCASCGATRARLDIAVTDDEEIDRLLVEANLLRMRKQFDEAISICTRILRSCPNLAAAHALLGDIHHDEGNHREAMGWYKLAVQLDERNSAYRKKLDETIDKVFKHAAEQSQQNVSEDRGTFSALSSTRRSNLPRKIFDRITPTHVVITFAILALIAALSILGWSSRGLNAKKPGTSVITPSISNGTDTSTNKPPVQVTPPAPDNVEAGNGHNDATAPWLGVPPVDKTTTPGTGNAGQTGRTTPATPGTVGVPQVPPFEPPAHNKMTAEEYEKETQALKTALDNTLKKSQLPSLLVNVSIDPRSNAVTIYYMVPLLKTATETKQGLLFSGFQLIWAADQVDPRIRSYTLRGYAYPEPGKEPTLALLADITPQQANDARDAGDYKAVAKFLSNTWWRNDLDTASL